MLKPSLQKIKKLIINMKTQFSHFGKQEWRSGKSVVAFYQCGLGSILKAAT